MNISRPQLCALVLAASVVGGMSSSIPSLFADNLRSTSTITDTLVIPYSGYISLNSSPLDSPNQSFRFTLYEAATGGDAQWIETITAPVYQGRFTAVLGQGSAQELPDPNNPGSTLPAPDFRDVVLDAQKLYLSIELEDASAPGTFVALSGRQAIEAAPYAAWSGHAADFEVAGRLDVAQGAQINGSAGVQNDLNVGGQVDATSVAATQGVSANTITGASISASGSVTSTGRLFANQGITVGNDTTITGLDTLQGFNDLRLKGDSSSGALGDLYIASTGAITTAGSMTTGGNLTLGGADLSFDSTAGRGNGGRAMVQDNNDSLTINYSNDFAGGTYINDLKSFPAGNYCVFRRGGSCPTGFATGSIRFDTEDSNPNNYSFGLIGDAEVNDNIILHMCCK